MTDRREFILKSSLTVGGFFFLNQLQAVPLFRQFIIANLNEDDEKLLKKLLLQANGYETYKTLNYQDNINAYRTNYYLVFGEKDATGTYTQKTIDNIKTYKPVTLDELHRACNIKENPLIEDVFPKLNTLFQSAITGLGTVGLVAYGTATLPAIIGGLTLSGIGIINTELVEEIFEKVKRDNSDLCKRTVERYYKENKENKIIIESDEVTRISKIPFKEEKKELEKKLPDANPVKIVSSKNIESSKDELLNTVVQDLTNSFNEWKKSSEAANSYQKRQEFLANLSLIDSEISSSLYIGKTAIQLIFNDTKLANDFYSVSIALKDAYFSYTKFTMAQPAIGTMALTANWVSAGLTIMSLFASKANNVEAEMWRSLFKQLKEMMVLIEKGFNAVLENQKMLFRQLSFLIELVEKNSKIEQAMIEDVNYQLTQLTNRLDLIEYNKAMQDISTTNKQLKTLFSNPNFDINNEMSSIVFGQYITHYVQYSSEISASTHSLCSYSFSTNQYELEEIIEENRPFEYQIGKIPVAFKALKTNILNFNNSYDRVLPNPIEWCRGVDLYLQSYLIVKPNKNVATPHLDEFINSGNKLKAFFLNFLNPKLFTELSSLHHTLSGKILDDIIGYIEKKIKTNGYEYFLSTYKSYLDTKIEKLDENRLRFGRGEYFEELFSTHSQIVTVREAKNDVSAEASYIFDYDVIVFLYNARDLGIIDLKEDYVDSGSKMYNCKFIEGNFQGLEIKFTGNTVEHLYLLASPHRKKKFRNYVIRPDSNGKLWKENVLEVVRVKNISPDFYKLRKIDFTKDNPEITFIEFIINETFCKFDRIKSNIHRELLIDLPKIMQSKKKIYEEFSVCGYLLCNQLTAISYNELTTPYDDYRDIQTGGRRFANFLVHPPKFATSKDYINVIFDFFLQDFLNEWTHGEKWSRYKSRFSAQKQDTKPIIDFLNDGIGNIRTEQKNYFSNLQFKENSLNYNIKNTLFVLEQLKIMINQ